jgi:GGDEF domain-containing protein
MTAQLLEFAALGVDDVVLVLPNSEPDQITRLAARFATEVIGPFRHQAEKYCAAAVSS